MYFWQMKITKRITNTKINDYLAENVKESMSFFKDDVIWSHFAHIHLLYIATTKVRPLKIVSSKMVCIKFLKRWHSITIIMCSCYKISCEILNVTLSYFAFACPKSQAYNSVVFVCFCITYIFFNDLFVHIGKHTKSSLLYVSSRRIFRV